MEPSDPQLSPIIPALGGANCDRQDTITLSGDRTSKIGSGYITPTASQSSGDVTGSVTDSNQEEEFVQPRVDTLYVVHLDDPDGLETKDFYTDRAYTGVDFGLSEPDSRADSKEAILIAGVDVRSNHLQEKEGNSASNWWKKRINLDIGGQIPLEQTWGQYIKVSSKRLVEVLESVIDYAPLQWAIGLDFYPVNSKKCFTGLMLYYAELKAIHRKFAETSDNKDAKNRELSVIDEDDIGSTATDLDSTFDRVDNPATTLQWDEEIAAEVAVLLNHLRSQYRRHVIPILRKLRSPEPRVAYEHLWFVYKSGNLVYKIKGDEVVALVVVAAHDQRDFDKDGKDQGRRYEVEAWYLEHAGRHLRRQSVVTKVDHFDGDRPLMSLPVIPAAYYDAVNGGKVRRDLETRGQKFFGIIKDGYAHRTYTHPYSRSEGRIIVDPEKYNDKWASYKRDKETRSYVSPEFYGLDIDSTDDDIGILSGSLDYREPSDRHGHRRFQRYHDIDTKDQKQLDNLLPQGIILLSPRIGGMALSTKRWTRFRVEGISNTPPWKPAKQLEESLVLDDPHDKEILRTVLLKETESRSFQSDFISGKGEGQVFLLYGPPGSGKTLTAECVANDSRRPLVSLTPPDIVGRYDCEHKLREWFVLAAKWDAILLIDEADIFLEKRQTGVSEVNSITTVFLRMMEYYAGVLFLTTNRPGKIDDSFISRVTPVRYPEVTLDVRNQIWDKFFELYRKFHKIEVPPKARKTLRSDTTRLNGREVRNIFRNAINMAKLEIEDERQPPTGSSNKGHTGCVHEERDRWGDCSRPTTLYVNEIHFSKALERHKDFKEYMNQLNRNMDEPTRSRMTGNY